MAEVICIKCGECCSRWPISINLEDFQKSNVEETYKKLICDDVGIKLGPVTQVGLILHCKCDYYDESEHSCAVYAVRPNACRKHFCGRYSK